MHDEDQSNIASVVERNIRTLMLRRKAQDAAKSPQDRLADAITRFSGSMKFVYIHAVLFGLWIVINLGWLPVIRAFDPTFVVLAMFASVEAIFLSTFVLISQNRMAEREQQRADLDLQISLLSEHEITHLITLVKAIAEKLKIDEAANPHLDELARDVRPEAVLETMESTAQKLSDESNGAL